MVCNKELTSEIYEPRYKIDRLKASNFKPKTVKLQYYAIFCSNIFGGELVCA